METRNRLEVKTSKDRDDPHGSSVGPVQVVERMGETVVVEGVDWYQNNEAEHQPGPESFMVWMVWARRFPPTSPPRSLSNRYFNSTAFTISTVPPVSTRKK
jgi:hypothetical protein